MLLSSLRKPKFINVLSVCQALYVFSLSARICLCCLCSFYIPGIVHVLFVYQDLSMFLLVYQELFMFRRIRSCQYSLHVPGSIYVLRVIQDCVCFHRVPCCVYVGACQDLSVPGVVHARFYVYSVQYPDLSIFGPCARMCNVLGFISVPPGACCACLSRM